MRVLVTGARGLLGSTLCPFLKACGHQVISQSKDKATELACDLTDYQQMESLFSEASPEAIINLAALTNVDQCEAEPYNAYLINTHIVENLADWITNYSPETRLIQISTDQVYDGIGNHAEDNVCLKNYYAYSKYAGELAALQVNGTVLRTNFFGVSQCPRRNTISDWFINSFRSGIPITLFEDIWFSPLEINHLCRLIELVVMTPTSGRFNVCSINGISKANFAEILADQLGLSMAHAKRGSSDLSKSKAYRPKNMIMNAAKFESTFNVGLPTIYQSILSSIEMYRHS